MAIKSVWNLNVDELLVANGLKHKFSKKRYEVFFPINAQLKNIDLIFLDMKKLKPKTIQVKGSRTYSPKPKEKRIFGEGRAGWIYITKDSVYNPQNRVGFYILVLHTLVDGESKKEIEIDYLIIPEKNFKKIISKKQMRRTGTYHFFIWIDHNGKRAFDFNNLKRKQIDLSKYLNNWDLLLK